MQHLQHSINVFYISVHLFVYIDVRKCWAKIDFSGRYQICKICPGFKHKVAIQRNVVCLECTFLKNKVSKSFRFSQLGPCEFEADDFQDLGKKMFFIFFPDLLFHFLTCTRAVGACQKYVFSAGGSRFCIYNENNVNSRVNRLWQHDFTEQYFLSNVSIPLHHSL